MQTDFGGIDEVYVHVADPSEAERSVIGDAFAFQNLVTQSVLHLQVVHDLVT